MSSVASAALRRTPIALKRTTTATLQQTPYSRHDGTAGMTLCTWTMRVVHVLVIRIRMLLRHSHA